MIWGTVTEFEDSEAEKRGEAGIRREGWRRHKRPWREAMVDVAVAKRVGVVEKSSLPDFSR